FAKHYSIKAAKASKVAKSTRAAEALIGDIPPWEGRVLYSARVDPHLTFGCEVSLDIDATLLRPLGDVQHQYLRRSLGLSARCATVVLFTDTGLQPLRYRRALLALRYLQYMFLLGDTASLISCALTEAFALACNSPSSSSWKSDLHHVLAGLQPPVVFDYHCPLSATLLSRLVDAVTAFLHASLRQVVSTLPKLSLLATCTKTGDGAVLAFWHYLHVLVPQHRVALMRLLVSDHPLAVECLR
ncbi:hypothetical protein OBBRIDRAFT_572675, partial [Obba rivulosa]